MRPRRRCEERHHRGRDRCSRCAGAHRGRLRRQQQEQQQHRQRRRKRRRRQRDRAAGLVVRRLYYEGSGKPDYIIASDLPLQGSGRTQTMQMTKAIKFVLKQENCKAGKYTIGYQSCDDSTAQAGKWDSGKCSANANAYAQNKSVIGVIGTFNSGCAEIIDPDPQPRARTARSAMVSPANTYVGLTHSGPGTAAGEPDKYYPTGKRNYVRVVAADDFQGAADALLAKSARRQEGLHPERQGGLRPRRRDELQERGEEARPQGRRLHGLGRRRRRATRRSRPRSRSPARDAVFLGGLVCENGGKLIKDLTASVLGREVLMMLRTASATSTRQRRGRRSGHVHHRRRRRRPRSSTGAGADVRQGVRQADRQQAEPVLGVRRAGDAGHARRDREVRRDARERDRRTCFKTNVTNGILGNFSINANGDTNAEPGHDLPAGRIGEGTARPFKTIIPPRAS